MSSSPTVPTPTPASSVASTQTGLNTTAAEQSQAGSSTNQSNPYGNLTYSQTGTSSTGVPMYTATESLSPSQQGLYNTYTGTQQTAGNQAQNLLDTSGYGTQSAASAIGNETTGLTGQAMAQEQAYLQPTFSQQTSQLDSQLQNEGFNPGTPGYQQAMNGLLQSQNQTTTGFEASIEPQMFSQAESTYELPAELGGTLASLGAPTSPTSNFVSTPSLSVTPANYEGDVSTEEQEEMAAYQAQLQQSNAMMSGLFGLGSAALGGLAKGATTGGTSSLASSIFSDRRLKKDIKRVGVLDNGLPVYTFRFIDDPVEQLHMGLMAQDVEKVRPEAVIERNGFKAVYYDLATER
jgi:hypothetical protein